MSSRKVYNREFKLEAIALAKSSDKSHKAGMGHRLAIVKQVKTAVEHRGRKSVPRQWTTARIQGTQLA
jgi:transposase-like protein